MRVGAIDLGTNSFLLLVAEVGEQGEIKSIVHDESKIVRLGEGVNASRRLAASALKRAEVCLSDFVNTARICRCDKVLAVATSAARDASNQSELIAIGKSLHLKIEVIDGLREAELTFRGSVRGLVSGPVCVVDVGGGSTEFVFGDGEFVQKKMSLDIGVVRLNEMFGSQSGFSWDLAEKFVNSLPGPEIGSVAIISVGGTPTTLAHISKGGGQYDSGKIHGAELTKVTLLGFREQFENLGPTGISKKYGVESGRADVLLPGLLILLNALERTNASKIIVSTGGVRFGVAAALGSGALC